MADNSELELMVARLRGENIALRVTLSALIADMADTKEDPEHFILNLLAPLHEGVAASTDQSPMSRAGAEGMLDAATRLEAAAFEILSH
ncbi:hypothetical protein [Roseobacter sp. TSBP12]|uniref:hypothetical protein n=1 Tax=Roseobacter sp. TSBP12 TaxID=1236613 RepID=UPI00125EFA4A|nr:hypothetical protein [Roseobacter sp. TSBP12]KAB6714311.1 hypothetical protein C8029_21465 [Roseobacter sp. TSBP12]